MEITFKHGQIVTVYGEPDDDGFYMGEVDGLRGLVPSNYLQEVGEYAVVPTQDTINTYLYNHNRTAGSNVQRHTPSTSQYDRGHGPGAKGPPPPPRDGIAPKDPRERRKGILNIISSLVYNISLLLLLRFLCFLVIIFIFFNL